MDTGIIVITRICAIVLITGNSIICPWSRKCSREILIIMGIVIIVNKLLIAVKVTESAVSPLA